MCMYEYHLCTPEFTTPLQFYNVNQGIMILEDLCRLHPDGRRDYIYYLAFGNARIKNYTEGLKYCRAFLDIESNDQVRSLEVSLLSKQAGLQMQFR